MLTKVQPNIIDAITTDIYTLLTIFIMLLKDYA